MNEYYDTLTEWLMSIGPKTQVPEMPKEDDDE